MGQKVSPVGLRVGVNRNWNSRWYANDKDFASLLHEDIKIREFLYAKLKGAYVANIEIERSKNRVSIYVHTSRPGVVIGKDGEAKWLMVNKCLSISLKLKIQMLLLNL